MLSRVEGPAIIEGEEVVVEQEAGRKEQKGERVMMLLVWIQQLRNSGLNNSSSWFRCFSGAESFFCVVGGRRPLSGGEKRGRGAAQLTI